MGKVIINEKQFKTLMENAVTMQYTIEPDKVLIIQKFLNTGEKANEPRRFYGFTRGKMEEIGPDGGMVITPCFGQKDRSGNVIRNIMQDEMIDLLLHEYPKIYSDEDRKRKFLGKVMEDWYNNKIGLYGSLSVNHL